MRTMFGIQTLLVLALSVFAQRAQAAHCLWLKSAQSSKPLSVCMFENRSAGVLGDILYFPSILNRHNEAQPLIDSWVQAGFRVVTFVQPPHVKIKEMLVLAKDIERQTREEDSRPLFLAGWSRGGLSVMRALQENSFRDSTRPVAGALIFAPGLKLRWFDTKRPLTHTGTPKEKDSAEVTALFDLGKEGKLALQSKTVVRTPVLLLVPGDDHHVKPKATIQWYLDVKNSGQFANIKMTSYPQAHHQLFSEELGYGGESVSDSTNWLLKAIGQSVQ